MSSVPGDARKILAVQYLERVKQDLERAKRTRTAYVKAAKEHGLTNQQIGEAVGVSEGRVRQLLGAE